eukprot:4126298-Pleurochrysis_carterae.AAC.1
MGIKYIISVLLAVQRSVKISWDANYITVALTSTFCVRADLTSQIIASRRNRAVLVQLEVRKCERFCTLRGSSPA